MLKYSEQMNTPHTSDNIDCTLTTLSQWRNLQHNKRRMNWNRI